MKQRPVAIGVLVCEQVVLEEKTRNVTPVNCFSHRAVDSFPSEAFPFVVFAMLTDGIGDVPLELRINRLDTFDEIYHLPFSIQFTSPLQEVRCIVRIKNCSFPVSGHYQVAILASNEPLPPAEVSHHGKGELAMSASQPDSAFDKEFSGFDSRDCVNVVIDGPGDTTVRPMPPHLLKIALAERERMERLLKQLEEEKASAPASDTPPTDGTA